MNNEILIALVTTLFGGIGLELLKIIASSVEKRRIEKKTDRENFEKNLMSLEAQIDSLTDSIDSWKEKYFVIREDITLIRTYVNLLIDILETKSPTKSEQDLIISIRNKVLGLE